VNPLCRDLLLNGLRQRVWMFDGQAPAILALHGFTGSGRDFAPIADPLERQIAAPDLEGHGPDIPTDPDAYTMARVTAGLEATMNELELGRVPVLGYSMGGRTALQFALAAPERVEALILVGATPGLRDPAEASARRIQDEAIAQRIEGNGVHDFADWWEQLPILASQDRIAEPWRTAMRQRRRRQSGPGLASSLRGMGTGAMKSVWARLVELDIPTLLLTGEHDLKFTALAQEMLGLLPQASHVVLRRAGHCAHLERPDEAAAQIQAFLRELAIR
jgi:2-succinyl-6-hydroxy-2,4-cyclohexadiene-1-carboxylate synthase